MFELPEFFTLAKQMNTVLPGKVVVCGQLGNSPHKFVWYNRSHEEFTALTKGKCVGRVRAKGKWLFMPLEPGYVLLIGECGGKVLYHPPGDKLPTKYHLSIEFEDGSALTVVTQMWGLMDLYEAGKESERQYVHGMRPTPIAPEFTFDYFNNLIDEHATGKKRSVKSLLTHEQLIPGLGNAIAQDILFAAALHPTHLIHDLTAAERRALYNAIIETVQAVIAQGGRNDEYDLFGERGGYVRKLDSHAVGQPCPHCGSPIEKMQYLGGACYYCPTCQK